MLSNSAILITGGTGSFGREFIYRTLQEYSPRKIVVFSRDEMKQWDMAKDFRGDDRLRFFIGDVRDKDRLRRACEGIDYIVHAAALKIVPTAEYNPFEYIKTNVLGAMNVIDCALDCGVKKVVALSTDKASNPINLYGATKLCSDKLFVSGNVYTGIHRKTSFSVVRYGNVMGSRGSVIPFFKSLAQGQDIPITDNRMTRFMITLDQAVELVFDAFRDSKGGEIFVPKIPSMKITDIASVIRPMSKLVHIGIRPGEKLHEQMIGKEDARSTFEFTKYYKIMPQIEIQYDYDSGSQYGKRCQEDFEYTSDTNSEWMKPEELQNWLNICYDEQRSVRSNASITHSKQITDTNNTSTTIIENSALENTASIKLAASAFDYINSGKYEEALTLIEGSKLMQDELLFPKAVAFSRLGRNLEALQVLISILAKDPTDVRVRRLFVDISREIGTIS